MFFNLMGVVNATSSSSSSSPPQTNVSCTCNCKRSSTSLQSMEISQLEFVQILVIVVVMLVMVVVITCLLNHYRLSARSLLSRHTHASGRHLPLANEGSLWSSEGPATGSGLNEHQVYTPRPPDRGVPPSYLQRDPHTHPHHHHHHHQHQHHSHLHQQQRFQPTTTTYPPSRFQPTYPYLPQSLVDLPPTISLSDGEEPPPYQGPCTLQLRDPEQQLELNRESVRAPPNRTVYDSHLLHPNSSSSSSSSSSASTSCLQASLQAPPPSVHAGVSAFEGQEASSRQQKQGPGVEGAPPAYSEVIGHYYHPTSLPHPHRTVVPSPSQAPPPPTPPSSLIHGLLRPPPPPSQQAPPTPGSVANRNARNAREKSHKPQQV